MTVWVLVVVWFTALNTTEPIGPWMEHQLYKTREACEARIEKEMQDPVKAKGLMICLEHGENALRAD